MREVPISGSPPAFLRYAAWRVSACTTNESRIATSYSEGNVRIRMVEPVHFKPDGDNGSYKWQKHDWHYEAEYYRKHEVPIRIQF